MHDPKNRDLAEIMRMLAFQMEGVLAAMPEDGPQGITIVWDTRNTGLKNTDNEFLREFLQFFKAQVGFPCLTRHHPFKRHPPPLLIPTLSKPTNRHSTPR